MRKMQILLLFLTLFLCSSLPIQAQLDTDKRSYEVKTATKLKPKQKPKPKTGVKAKMLLDENGNRIAPTQNTNTQEGKVESKLAQDANTKFAPATKAKKKIRSNPPTRISIDSQIKSIEKRISNIQNSDTLNKEAELDKLRIALARKKALKAKSN